MGIPRDYTRFCSLCNRNYPVRGYDVCEECAPYLKPAIEGLAGLTSGMMDKMISDMEGHLKDPARYGMDEEMIKKYRNLIRLMRDEQRQMNREVDKSKG